MFQGSLFDMDSADAPRARERETPSGQSGSEVTLQWPSVQQTASPLANSLLHEVCAACGSKVGADGGIIPDFEELGTFCSPECADRGFRLYLEEEAGEGG